MLNLNYQFYEIVAMYQQEDISLNLDRINLQVHSLHEWSVRRSVHRNQCCIALWALI